MSTQAILLPLFVHVALIFLLAIRTLRSRHRALQGAASAQPARGTGIPDRLQSQLQLSLLFFVLVILAMMTRKADLLFVVMSWVLVVVLVVHAAAEAGSGGPRLRAGAFAAAILLLLAMWVIFALRILLAGVEPV
ncbi:MAPEG family protein [Inquilinus limosus]|uniref:MAPEG family protein n=1 Tax=Inquilinus limosus TaxID=171674 RepID=UPI000408DFA4|nr:MAPEG family protein [Inquilinus limosus]